jgi:Ca2+-binding RTX toxin-like protein
MATFPGTTGNDILTGTAADDTLPGLADSDILNGGLGLDFLSGAAGNDTLIGGVGNDVLIALRGHTADAGADTALFGGSGNDLYVLSDGGIYTRWDSSGVDQVVLVGPSTLQSVDLSALRGIEIINMTGGTGPASELNPQTFAIASRAGLETGCDRKPGDRIARYLAATDDKASGATYPPFQLPETLRGFGPYSASSLLASPSEGEGIFC